MIKDKEKKVDYKVKYARVWKIIKIVHADAKDPQVYLPIQIKVDTRGKAQAIIDRLREYYKELQRDFPTVNVALTIRPVLCLRETEKCWQVIVKSPLERKGGAPLEITKYSL